MKKIIDWLFGYYKQSPFIQGVLAGIVMIHFGILGGWVALWLISVLPWPTK